MKRHRKYLMIPLITSLLAGCSLPIMNDNTHSGSDNGIEGTQSSDEEDVSRQGEIQSGESLQETADIESSVMTGTETGTDSASRSDENGTYYAYGTLSESGRAVYDAMYEAMRDFSSETTLPSTDEDEIDTAFNCVMADHPELFYTNGFQYVKYTLAGVLKKIVMKPSYTMDSEEAGIRQKQIDEYTVKCLDGIADGSDDYDKIKYIYEYIIDNTDYSLDAEDSQNICSVFIGHSSVCQGYAKSFQYLLQKAGIESVTVNGKTDGNEPHAWNLVRSSGNWYYADVTWGDAQYQKKQGDASETSTDLINYDYLCVTTEDISKTHTADSEIDLPECSADSDNYYIREGLYFTDVDKDRLEGIFKQAESDGRDEVRFRCSDSDVYDEMYSYLLDDQHIFDYIGGPGNSITYVSSPQACTFGFWIGNK